MKYKIKKINIKRIAHSIFPVLLCENTSIPFSKRYLHKICQYLSNIISFSIHNSTHLFLCKGINKNLSEIPWIYNYTYSLSEYVLVSTIIYSKEINVYIGSGYFVVSNKKCYCWFFVPKRRDTYIKHLRYLRNKSSVICLR